MEERTSEREKAIRHHMSFVLNAIKPLGKRPNSASVENLAHEFLSCLKGEPIPEKAQSDVLFEEEPVESAAKNQPESPEQEDDAPEVMDDDAIDDLCKSLKKLCRTPVANSREQAEEWLANREMWLSECLNRVDPLPDEMLGQVNAAVSAWERIETRLLSATNKTRDDVIHELQTVREAISQSQCHDLKFRGQVYCNVVRNIGWINAFAWQLPTAHPQNAGKYRSIAIMMLAFMYFETYYKGDDGMSGLKYLDPLYNIITGAGT